MTHYYDEKQDSPLREEKVIVRLFGKEYPFVTASGLFSKNHLDLATHLLITKCNLTGAKKVLDLGCGWGVVGIIIKDQLSVFSEQNGDSQSVLDVWASDINERAILYTKKNARLNKLKINVVKSSLFDNLKDEMFDTILTNPPYVAGRAVCFAFIEESFNHLVKGGSLQLVARHNKGGKTLSEKMESVFGNVESLAKQSGFRIYRSIKL